MRRAREATQGASPERGEEKMVYVAKYFNLNTFEVVIIGYYTTDVAAYRACERYANYPTRVDNELLDK